jgi:hypothetical protein
MPARSPLIALVLLITAGTAGCAHHAAEGAAIETSPATVTAVTGSQDLHQVQLTADAAAKIGLTTNEVRAVARDPRLTAVALGAVIYDASGATWVYVQKAPLTFQRQRVTISQVMGADAVLRSGPQAGTTVAAVGVAELLGSEDGVPGE